MPAREIYMTHRERTLQLATLVSPTTNRLAHHRFESCVLQGPAVVLPIKNFAFTRVEWGGKLDEVWFALPPGTRLGGVIGMEESEFIDCRFVGVGFVGTPHGLAQVAEHTAA